MSTWPCSPKQSARTNSTTPTSPRSSKPGPKPRTDLIELYTEQGRRWQALDLGATRRKDVARYIALVAEQLQLVEQTLALAEQVKPWTIEALLTKSDEQLGLEALLGRRQ